jgi:uncharacterized membrane protein YedE/YeeE
MATGIQAPAAGVNDGRRRQSAAVPVAYQALAGGALIGCSAALLLACNGRIAGISGIINGIYPNSPFERVWRLLFLLSLVGAAAIAFQFFPSSRPHRVAFPPSVLVLAGLLVGFGTRMGKGCTSGHGVCGLGRLSVRSLVAVPVFMGVAILTVAVTHHLWPVLP